MNGVNWLLTVSYTHLDVYKRQMQKRKSGRGRDDSRPYPFTDLFDLRAYASACLLYTSNETQYSVDLNDNVTKMTQANGGEYTYSYDLSLIHIY